MPDPTILFCIGAQKAGTTWLYEYLAGHPDCHLRAVKELHYFNTVDASDPMHGRVHIVERAERIRAKLSKAWFFQHRDRRRELADIEEWLKVTPDPEDRAYAAYLRRRWKGQKLIGDITPAYATLDRGGFARMARLGEDVRFVFVLRDPVERAWSQARMMGSGEASDAEVEATVRRIFDAFIRGDKTGMQLRSDYARTLNELLAAVPRERIHVMFFEEMFDQKALDRLTDFLGIRHWPGKFEKISHRGRPLALDDERRRRASRALAGQYAFCEQFFNGCLPDRWRAHMLEA
ncbi:sulfotransferase [Halovulum dunhuangense]|uniref:Sulfotransferase n=1 Tax=Halovulum dunhuangense TaxID=1505036 RepID=A0A849L6Y7_9RHOB|nr:sulfotransferase [Halovulum dunhuangense]NNU81831.1 sulfotransferase [Halovulum dunhuangense]